MPRRRLWRHVFALLSAVLQVALPLGVTYADGRLAADGGRARAHAEADRSSSCRPVHSPECGLCRHLASHSAPPVAPAATVDADLDSSVALGSPAEGARAAVHELSRSRGPPTS